MKLTGKWFDGCTSNSTPAIMTILDDGSWKVVRANDQTLIHFGDRFQPTVSPRLANTPRYLSFSGDESFETNDNDGVDRALPLLQQKSWSPKLHLLESRFRYVLLAVIIFVGLAFAGVKYGVPTVSYHIAQRIPQTMLSTASSQTLAIFDKMLFKPSELEEQKERQVRAFLQPALDDHPELAIEIVFRKGEKIKENAFALPDGRIIITDEMVQLIEKDEELLAIVYHEIGHIVHKHGIRRLIQNSLLSFALLSITGDTSGVSEVFLGLPVLLTELGYSRDFEFEADRYAVDYLKAHSISPDHFSTILLRLSKTGESNEGNSNDQKWFHYFSTHPATVERVQIINSSTK